MWLARQVEKGIESGQSTRLAVVERMGSWAGGWEAGKLAAQRVLEFPPEM